MIRTILQNNSVTVCEFYATEAEAKTQHFQPAKVRLN